MEIQEMFEFPFVDRTNETKKVVEFFKQNFVNTLWINGKSGTGKTAFIKNALLQLNEQKPVYICFNPDSVNSCCLQQIVEELERLSDKKFISFIKSHYEGLFDITKQVTTQLASLSKINISWFFELLFDTSKQFVTYKKEQESLIKVINNYIASITQKNKLNLILDNLMYCDKESLDVLCNIIKSNAQNKCIKFVLITTTEILLKNPDVQKVLTEGFKTEFIEIKEFDKSEYFMQILINSFDLREEEVSVIKDIYNICSGTPESLKTMLRNLFLNGSIIVDANCEKAKFKNEAIKNYIVNQISNSQSENAINFNKFDTIEQIVLQIIIMFESNIHMDSLIKCSEFVTETLLGKGVNYRYEILDRLIKLEQIHIIKNENTKVLIYHDLLFYALREHFKNSIIRKQMSYIILQFIKQNETMLLDNGLDYSNLEYFIVKLCYISQCNKWQEKVFAHFDRIFKQHKVIEARNGFSWLNSEISSLSPQSQLEICSCYYECGDYTQAYDIITLLEEELLPSESKFEFYFLKGKLENVLMQKKESVKSLKIALSKFNSLDERIKGLNLLQLVLNEIYGRKEEAKNIFTEACKLITQNSHYTLAACNLLRNCMNYYKHNDAIWYYQTAMQIAKKYKSNIDIAFVLNNYAFIHLKNGQLEKAYYGFEKAKEILDEYKIHESSYALVNMALCKLFNKDYEAAKSFLLEALVWNRSLYIDYVIKIHLANCYYHLDEISSYVKTSKSLFKMLKSNELIDGTIIRKLGINLAILFEKNGDIVHAKECIDIALPYVNGTSSEYRAHVIKARLEKNVFEGKCCYCDYYSITDFEPWGVTLSHD